MDTGIMGRVGVGEYTFMGDSTPLAFDREGIEGMSWSGMSFSGMADTGVGVAVSSEVALFVAVGGAGVAGDGDSSGSGRHSRFDWLQWEQTQSLDLRNP